MQTRRERRGGWALALSLALHALLLLWASTGLGPSRERLHRSAPIEVTIVTVEAPRAREEPKGTPAKAAARPSRRAEEKAAAAVATVDPVVAPAAPASGASGATPADAPRAARLEPGLGIALPGVTYGEGEISRGHTVVNGPGEEPDAVALRSYTEDTLKRRLDEELANGAAAARARSGLLDPYFSKLGRDLGEGLGEAGVDLRQRTPAEVLREDVVGTWQDVASRYGKDGNPMASAEQERKVTDTGLGRMAESASPALGDVGFQREAAKAMQQMGAMQAFVDSAQRARLKTIIELTQDASGALAEAVFLERSGDDEFDEFVLHQARKVVRERGEVEEGEPPYKDGWRSVWQFTWEPPRVKVKLLRVLRGQPPQPLLLPRP